MATMNNQTIHVNDLPSILQLDQAGNPHGWINYERMCYYMAKDLVAWSMGEMEFDLHGGINAETGLQSKLTINTIVAVKGNMSEKRMQIFRRTPLNNTALFRRDWNICAYCGESFTNGELTRDHVHPRSKGGPDVWTNVVTCCGPCNRYKDNKSPEEAGMQLLYVPYEPSRHEFLILKNRRILADQYDFLMKGVPKHSRLHQLN